MDEQCLFCRHFEADGDNEQPDAGFCRRYPPQLVLEDDGLVSIFPFVVEDCTCGEFSRRTN